jgi:hypothetical protein
MTIVLHNYTTTIQAQRRYGQHDANNITVIQEEKSYGHHDDNKRTVSASTEIIWPPCRRYYNGYSKCREDMATMT